MIFNHQLKILREQHHLTQQEMADRLCMDQSTYSRHENGVTHATADLILLVAEEFNVSTDWLLKDEYPQQTFSVPEKK